VPVRCTHWNIYEESDVYGTKSIKNKVEAGKWNTIWIIIRIVTNHSVIIPSELTLSFPQAGSCFPTMCL
jgi:hypothetical protein